MATTRYLQALLCKDFLRPCKACLNADLELLPIHNVLQPLGDAAALTFCVVYVTNEGKGIHRIAIDGHFHLWEGQ
eukprot:scaffold7095_cov260-Pinguiococcus_pyrenoidosus.AAC.10